MKSKYIVSLEISGDTNIFTYLGFIPIGCCGLYMSIIKGVYIMKAIDFTDYPNERCFINRSEDTMIYLKLSTDFIAVANINNEGAYRIEVLNGAYDTPALKHFVAFLKSLGLNPEEYIA